MMESEHKDSRSRREAGHELFSSIRTGLLIVIVCALAVCAFGARRSVDEYDVIWETPSKDSSGSMPIGNGDIGLNLWVDQAGELVFYISKTDSWSENARLLKLGLVRVKTSPALWEEGMTFNQRLNLGAGEIEINAGQGERRKRLTVWVDANKPVIFVEAEGEQQFDLEARLEIWRTGERELKGAEAVSARGLTRNDGKAYPIIVYPDTVATSGAERVVWYHRNEKSCYPVTLENQHLGQFLDKYPDPLMHRTFGACMKGNGLSVTDGVTLKSKDARNHFVLEIHPLTAQTKTSKDWLGLLDEQVEQTDSQSFDGARTKHRAWWKNFWDRSWIDVSGEAQAQEITTNTLPLRIGAGSEAGNRFRGYVRRVRVFGEALGDDEIAQPENGHRPVGDWLFENANDGVFANRVSSDMPARIIGDLKTAEYKGHRCVRFDGSGYIEIAHDPRLNFAGGCTLEAWIAPEKIAGGGARIIDKSKTGTANGYLLDTYPGNSLRLIVEAGTLIHDAKLAPGEWTHVVGTYNAVGGLSRLYIDGKRVAENKTGSSTYTLSRGYALQRWINACGGRGNYPIKFNGSIFTVDAQIGNEHFDGDYRRWGAMYWWQNTRFPYWSMLTAGDFDLMEPLFAMYKNALGLCRDKTAAYYQHSGAFFPETMYFWGTNGNCDYGWGHPGPETVNQYIRREWQGGIEITAMMLDYYAMTQDERFLRETVMPIAGEVLTFYSEHWGRDAEGRIRFEPAQALETWWQCVNPTPEVAGLRHVVERLLGLPKGATDSQRAAWRKLLEELPPVPMKEEDGQRFVLPAERFDVLRNSENPELYAVFPYRLYGLGAGDLEIGLETWRRRRVKGSVGWRQDSIQAGYLGLADEAARYVAGNFSTWHKGSRFPAFWGPNFDWIPDQDHGCVAMIGLQRMLLQDNGDEIIVLPAWPKNWDVVFKLHAGGNTTVECEVRGEKVVRLEVKPSSRRAAVKLGSQWR